MPTLDEQKLNEMLNKDPATHKAFNRVCAIAQVVGGEYTTDVEVTDKDDPSKRMLFQIHVKQLPAHHHPDNIDKTSRPGDPKTFAELKTFLTNRMKADHPEASDKDIEELVDGIVKMVDSEDKIPELMAGWHYAEDNDKRKDKKK